MKLAQTALKYPKTKSKQICEVFTDIDSVDPQNEIPNLTSEIICSRESQLSVLTSIQFNDTRKNQDHKSERNADEKQISFILNT
jgi:hypothetical protein